MKYDKDIVVKWFAEHGIRAIPEYKFHPDRKWRFDFVFVDDSGYGVITDETEAIQSTKLALEVQGGLFTNGRHTRGAALMKEHEKLNTAAMRGWKVMYTIPQNLCMQETVEMVREALWGQ